MNDLRQKTIEFDGLKAKSKATWTVGDFGKIARFFTRSGVEFINRLNLTPGMRVLDVGCGTGNQSIPAARTGAIVTGLDIAPNLLEQAREKAVKESLAIRFDEGDAENLPYPEASFDVVFSMFGAIFAPRHDRVSAELVRVCRPGGRIVMANWTPDGFVGQMFKIINSHLPPANLPSPMLWGNERRLKMNFGGAVSSLECTSHVIDFTFPYSLTATLGIWREYYGPFCKTLHSLDKLRQEILLYDLEKLWMKNNLSTDGTTHIKTDYLEVVAVREQ